METIDFYNFLNLIQFHVLYEYARYRTYKL